MDDKALIVLLLIAAAIAAGGVATGVIGARGIRNHNPGNIRRTGIRWKGEVPDAEKTDREYEQFTSPVWGIRAIARELLTGAARGEDTIREIVAQWAPPNENPTEAYIDSVAKQTGLAPEARIDVRQQLFSLVSAIIRQENGMNPYPVDVIAEGIRLA